MTTPAQDGAAMIEVSIEALLAAVHADDPKREILVRIGDIKREAAALITSLSQAVAAEREACAALCDQWVTMCQDFDIKYTSARNYAVEAVKDIADATRARKEQG